MITSIVKSTNQSQKRILKEVRNVPIKELNTSIILYDVAQPTLLSSTSFSGRCQ